MSIFIQSATESDLPILAQMNKNLIEDEGSLNPMSLVELQERMRDWIKGNWIVDLIKENGSVIGYAVYQLRQDDYYPDKKLVYLRQYFVQHEQRNKGYGRLGINLLRENHFPKDCTVIIDVLASNPKGNNFWTKVGFQAYYTNMRL